MQALVPTGARNPNNYTAQRILDALRGVTGSRKFTFRYERLSSANVKLGDIDNVLSASISQNWLADIKRKATFTLTDLGGINYLSERIKPYIRLHMPPQVTYVPADVPVTIRAWGAEGGGSAPGKGGYAQGTFAVKAGTTLRIRAGGRGVDGVHGVGPSNPPGPAGGFNGGGTAGYGWNDAPGGDQRNGNSGGGASDVRVDPAGLADRILVAGGGGASDAFTGTAGGHGSGTVGVTGTTGVNSGSAGGGGGGSTSFGGAGGVGTVNGTAGTLGVGGAGAVNVAPGQNPGGAGGGGGGYYGGGGGASSNGFAEAGGGGGGSGYIAPTATATVTTTGVRAGHGRVEVEVAGTTTVFDYTGAAATFVVPGGTTAVLSDGGYVEWPQGVFLLSTPSRSVDEFGVVTRDVEGYDALQVYADDLVTARYTVSGPGTTTLVEDFEDTTYNVTWSGTWARSNVTPQAGTWSLKAPTTANNGTSDAVVTVPAGATSMTVWYKVSSESGFDFFRILRDGVLESQYSGEVAWTSRTISVAGVSQVTFRYVKDSGAVAGSDTAWIDGLTFTVPAPGAKYTDAVSNLLGSVPKNITASPLTLATAKEWKPGTPKLSIINELLSAINYESLSFDEDGAAIVRPYAAPSSRAEEYTYADNAQSVLLPEVDQTLDLFDIPNQWVLIVSDPDRPAIVGTYTNVDPSSPTSTVSRQRTIVDFRTEQDAADQTSLDAKAARLAFEASQVYEAIEFETGLMPIHSGNDVYRIVYGPLAVDAKYSEHTWEIDMEAGARMKHRARRVVNV